MTSHIPDAPDDWPALLAMLRADPRANAAGFVHYMQMIRAKPATTTGYGPTLARAAEVLNRGLVMGQGGHMARPVAMLRTCADTIAAAPMNAMIKRPASSQAVLAGAALSEMADFGAWDDLVPLALDRLWAGEVEGDSIDRESAFASVAWGHVDQMRRVLDPLPVGGGDGPFATPLDCLRQVAATLHRGAPATHATPAWRAYLAAFPKRLYADETTWNDLIWLARAVHVVLHGHAPTDVPQRLLGEIEAL